MGNVDLQRHGTQFGVSGSLPWEATHDFGPCEQAQPVILQVPESCLGLCTPASRVGC